MSSKGGPPLILLPDNLVRGYLPIRSNQPGRTFMENCSRADFRWPHNCNGKQSSLRIRLISWLVVSVGLFWQLCSVSQIYFRFPVRADITIDIPSNLQMPGLTVCLKLATPADPIVPLAIPRGMSTDLLGNFSRWSLMKYTPINRLATLPTEEVQIKCYTPWPELPKINVSGGDECENFVRPIETIQYNYEENQVYRCKTYFHQPPNSSLVRVFAKNSEFFYRVLFEASHNFWIAVYVHNPVEVLHLNEADTFRFETHTTDQMVLLTTKMTTRLLAYPYSTDCIDYTESRFGRMSCVYQCKIQMMNQICPTWPHDVPAQFDQPFPFALPDRSCLTPRRYLCSLKSSCKNACLNRWYSTAVIHRQERNNATTTTHLFVRRPFGAEINYNYVARLELIEFFCYVASCFGTWLGFSAADLLQICMDWFNEGPPSTIHWTRSRSRPRVKSIKVTTFKLSTNRCKRTEGRGDNHLW